MSVDDEMQRYKEFLEGQDIPEKIKRKLMQRTHSTVLKEEEQLANVREEERQNRIDNITYAVGISVSLLLLLAAVLSVNGKNFKKLVDTKPKTEQRAEKQKQD